MPCRALEAFGRRGLSLSRSPFGTEVLMPCRALEAFGRAAREILDSQHAES